MKFFSIAMGAVLSFSHAGWATQDIYKQVFDSVNKANIVSRLKDMSGASSVTVKGQSFTIKERQTESSKQLFRAYWKDYFESLGMPVSDAAYPGHDFEAVLPGASPDSIVLVVHYDSAGVLDNAGADDDMSGMTTMLEAARILSSYKGHLAHTVRFVATDFEEVNLSGAIRYANYIKQLARQQNFKVLLAIDYEQTGWSGGGNGDTFWITDCIHDGPYADVIERIQSVASTYGSLKAEAWQCYGGSDHSAFLDVGIPGFFSVEEHPLSNPYFDKAGDLFEIIDQDYLFKIAQIMITTTAQLVGLN